jgi:hypothetical protein
MKNANRQAAAALRLLGAKGADLEARAAKLWPDGEPHAEHNRREWLRAVGVVRATGGGWVVDRKAQLVAH